MSFTTVAIVALAIFIFSLISTRLRKSVITAPMAFTGVGLLMGEAGLQIIDIPFNHGVIQILAELTLVVVLFTDASRIDLKLLRKEHNLPVRLLTIGLTISIACGALFAWWLLPGLDIWQGAVLATIVAPTDAALAHAVVTNKLVPVRVRQTISVESGLNDGLCVPMFLVFVCGARAAEHPETTAYWLQIAARQVLLGPLVGVVVATVGATLLDRAINRNFISRSYLQLSSFALALLAFGGAEMIGGNGFIAAFCSGLSVRRISPATCRAVHEFAEVEGELLTLLVFLVFGAVLAPIALPHVTSTSVAFAVLGLTLLRMLPVAISLIGTKLRAETRLLVGWFGPRGIASIVFGLMLLEETEMPNRERIFAMAMTTVALSVFLHGMTAFPLAKWYAARTRGPQRLAAAEHKQVTEMPFHGTSAGQIH